MIESLMVPVIIAIEPEAEAAVARLGVADIPSGLIARQLQPFTVQVPEKARSLLVQNGHARFEAPHLRGDQFCVLATHTLYHQDTGLRWENAEYLAADQTMI